MGQNYKAIVRGKQHKERRPHRRLTNSEFMRVCDACCTYFQCSVDQLRDPGNMTRPPHQLARQAIMYLCWVSYDVSQEEIAERFQVHKASVNKAIDATEGDRDSHPIFDKFLTGVENDIIARRVAKLGQETFRDR